MSNVDSRCLDAFPDWLRSLGEDARLPPRAGDDLAVDGHGDAAGVRRDLQTAKRGRDGLAGVHVGLLSVEDDHDASPVETDEASFRSRTESRDTRRGAASKRAGEQAESRGLTGCPPARSSATSSAVRGARRMPFR